MRTRWFAVAIAGLAAILVCGMTPANAGGVGWDDREGDATQVGHPRTAGALPNDSALDITEVTLSSDAQALIWTARLHDASHSPSLSYGYNVRFEWTYEGASFSIDVGEYRDLGIERPAQRLHFGYRDDPVGFSLPCEGCRFALDEAANSIVLTVPMEALAEGTAAADSKSGCPACRRSGSPLPPVGRGSRLTDLSVSAQRHYAADGPGVFFPSYGLHQYDVRLTPTADVAPAPKGLDFTI